MVEANAIKIQKYCRGYLVLRSIDTVKNTLNLKNQISNLSVILNTKKTKILTDL